MSVTTKKEPKFIKASDIASELSVTSRQVFYWATSGKIPCKRFGKNCVRFNKAEVFRALGIETEQEEAGE